MHGVRQLEDGDLGALVYGIDVDLLAVRGDIRHELGEHEVRAYLRGEDAAVDLPLPDLMAGKMGLSRLDELRAVE